MEISEEDLVEEVIKTFKEKIENGDDWKIYIRTMLKIPNQQQNAKHMITNKYYFGIYKSSLEMDLSNDFIYSVVLQLSNTLLMLRKNECMVNAFKSQTIKNNLLTSLVSEISPGRILFHSFFSNCTETEIYEFYPILTGEIQDYITCQLAFKVKSRKDIEKLCKILKKYELCSETLKNLVRVWSSQSFLIHSLDQNESNVYIAITLIIHDLMHAKLDASVTGLLFSGIQLRLSSNISQISSSGLVIASRVSELLNSSEIIKFTVSDYLSHKQIESNSDSDHEPSEKPVKININYLEDMINGLISQDRDKFINSLESAENLISEELADLDLYLEKLAETLFKIENTFNFDSFEQCRFHSLVALTCVRPVEMCRALIDRVIDRGNSTHGKLLAFDVMRESARKLANPIEKKMKKIEEKPSKYQVIKERLKLKTRRFVSKPKPVFFGTPNLFFQYFEIFCSGIIKILTPELHFLVLSKGIYTISELIEHAGASCDQTMITQCIYLIKNIVKPYISNEKREVVESVLILLLSISEKLEKTDFFDSHSSVVFDIDEIIHKIEVLSGPLHSLAEKCVLSLLKYKI